MKKVLNYWPVVSIYLLSVVFASVWMTYVTHSGVFHFLEGFMASFLVMFGAIKLKDIKGFAKRFATYDLIAKKFPRYGFVYPFIEIGLGLLTLFMSSIVTDSLMVVLAAIGITSVYLSIIRKQRLYCACLGMAFNVPLSYVAIIENATMLLSAVAMIVIGHGK
jgi:hypothetical protein